MTDMGYRQNLTTMDRRKIIWIRKIGSVLHVFSSNSGKGIPRLLEFRANISGLWKQQHQQVTQSAAGRQGRRTFCSRRSTGMLLMILWHQSRCLATVRDYYYWTVGDGPRGAWLDESLYKSIDLTCQKGVVQADGDAVTVLEGARTTRETGVCLWRSTHEHNATLHHSQVTWKRFQETLAWRLTAPFKPHWACSRHVENFSKFSEPTPKKN